jgi:putative SOS response-associated peptidase YedK
VTADWGLINSWSTDPRVAYKQINARAETLANKPAWRSAYRKRRCVVVADGFYEWRGPKHAREPMWFHSAEGGLLWLAGLYESWQSPETGELRTTFTLITTAANRVVELVHQRMPVIVAESQIDQWISGPEHAELLRPAPDALIACRPVSRRVNSPRHDDPACLEPDPRPHEPPEISDQLPLFSG